MEEALCSLARGDREVRACHASDEERVPGQQRVAGQEATVLRPVPRGVQDPDPDAADPDLLAVLERLVRVLRLRRGMNADGKSVLEGEPAVAGQMVGMRVRLQHARGSQSCPLDLGEHRPDVVGRVDDDGLARLFVSDQVAGAAEVVVDELAQQHTLTVPPGPAVFPEASEPEVLRDHHSLDLVRPLADLQHLLVAVEARDGELVHEAVAAVDLQGVIDRAV